MKNPVLAADVRPAGVADWRTPVELGLLAAIWGASFLFQRVAAPEFGASVLSELRLVLGAAILLPFLLFAWAAQRAPAGVGAITNAMAVLFTALVAFAFFHEKIGVRKWIALAVGFVGVVVLASDKADGASVGPAAAAGMFAALMYGVGANLVPRLFAGLPPLALAAATLGCAALMSLPLAAWHWPEWRTRKRNNLAWSGGKLRSRPCVATRQSRRIALSCTRFL